MQIKTHVKLLSVPNFNLENGDILFENHNEVTDGSAEFLAGCALKLADYKITHIYGQWGEATDFPENGGPFFTPDKSDTIEDLTGSNFYTTDAEEPVVQIVRSTEIGQTRFVDNKLTITAFFTHNDGKVYIGAGLVCQPKGLLLGHLALNGALKVPGKYIACIWDWTFSNKE